MQAAVALAPDDAVAAEGLSLALVPDPPAVELFPAFALIGHAYPQHTTKSYAGTLSAGASVLLVRHVLVGGTYRGSLFAYDAPPAKTFTQHEGYVSAGWVAPGFGVVAQGAIARDGSGYSGTSEHVGGAVRVSPWGDGVAAGSYSHYRDFDVTRGELSWRVPLGERFWVRPAGALQRASGETLLTGYATVGYDDPAFGAWLGGKYGDEVRPAYLGVPCIYNIPERLLYGGWAGVRASLGDRWVATLSGEGVVLDGTSGRTPAFFGTLGLARSL